MGSSTPASSRPPGISGLKGAGEFIVVRAVVLMLSAELAAPPLSVTAAGEKAQLAPAGKPVHVNETVPVKPLLGVRVMRVCVDCPACTVADALEAATLNVGAALAAG